MLLPFHANGLKGACDLYSWECFQCIVIRNLARSNMKSERNKKRKEGKKGGGGGRKRRKERNSIYYYKTKKGLLRVSY